MTEPLGEARNYDELQAALRRRAEALGISRADLDELSGLPAGFASKALAEVPLRRLGPDTIGPMLGALGVKIIVAEDAEAAAKYAARAEKRDERYAKNAGMHSGAVHFRISRRKLRRRARKGGKHSRKFLTRRQARKLARKAAGARWRGHGRR